MHCKNTDNFELLYGEYNLVSPVYIRQNPRASSLFGTRLTGVVANITVVYSAVTTNRFNSPLVVSSILN